MFIIYELSNLHLNESSFRARIFVSFTNSSQVLRMMLT